MHTLLLYTKLKKGKYNFSFITNLSNLRKLIQPFIIHKKHIAAVIFHLPTVINGG